MARRLVLVVLLVALVQVVWSNENPVVRTRNGDVRGFIEESTKGKTIYSFMSIPFALPPVGPLRFKPPQPIEKWEKEVDGTAQPPFCIQLDIFSNGEITGQEDCLYLNVYSRQLPGNGNNPKLPVLIFIHGGGYTAGSGSPVLYPPRVLLNEEIVLATLNYRLGPLGFMSNADEIIQGNMGMKDQNMAMRWIKENIEAFGGDPDRITLSGQSAGSGSVHYHMLSPRSRGLFNQAISQSGSSLGYWAYLEPAEIASRTKRFAEALKCPIDNSANMLQCLQQVDAKEVINGLLKFYQWHVFPIVYFTPTKEVAGDDRFMDKSPREALAKGEVVDVPWMAGICDTEGEFVLGGIWKKKLLKDLNDNYLKIFPLLLGYDHGVDDPDKYSKIIREYYFGNKEISDDTLSELLTVISDTVMNYCNYDAVVQQAAANLKSPIYFYDFTFLGSLSFPQTDGLLGGGPDYKPHGTSHADDLFYLYQSPPVTSYKPGSPEEKMSDMMTTWWINFVSTGNPTPPGGKESAVTWEPLGKENLNHFNMSLTPHMQTEFFYDRMEFWKKIYAEMGIFK